MSEHIDHIQAAAACLGDGTLTESAIVEHIHPLFSRVLARNARTNEIYLANHSLGRPMDAISPQITHALDAWYEDLDDAWGIWIEQRDWYRKTIAKIINCPQWDAIVPKTSAGQGLRAAINSLPTLQPNIVSTRGEFDSIDFNLKAYAHKDRASLRWVEPDDDGLFHADDIINAINDDTDLVVISMVCFVTGQLITDLERIVHTAHEHNALILIDTYHSFGTIPIDFNAIGADFLIAGNYKYTRGGAGACFLAIHPRHLSASGGVPNPDSIFTTDTGWFAKQDTFTYRRTEQPEYASGGDAWLESTPPPLVYFQATPGLQLTESIGVDRLRTYSLQQQAFLSKELIKAGVYPRLLEHRGAFLLVETQDGHQAIESLKAHGVNADARPCLKTGNWQVRFCPDLLNTQAELSEAAIRIGKALNTKN
tara:strand:- start:99152 stop:100423 length:1272 start_codon:yes stop_codon:yes gene_type:complete